MLRYFCPAMMVLWCCLLYAGEVPLQLRLKRIESFSGAYGAGGHSVLQEGFKALSRSPYKLAGLEDLWATALKEGRTLFPGKRLWRATLPAETGDMLGQITIGPWQITVANAREYGASYGIGADWDARRILSFLESHPELQARIAADFMEESYRDYGRRAPLAVQRYFWLDGFLQKKIGQGPWFASVLAKSPAEMAQTGFYAKQLLLGSRFNPDGLLYWLYRTGDEDAVRDTLRLWKEKGHALVAEDLDHCSCDPEFREWIAQLIRDERNL